jgi:2-hydroxychromene-2-carboxylate isomerase
MTARVEYFFDFGSPTSYLAWTQLPRVAAAAGARIDWRPMLLGGVFKATGNASPVAVPAKGRWMNADIARWAKRYGVPFRFNPHFPINTLTLMRGAAGLQMRRPELFERYVATINRAMWEEPADLGDPAVLAATSAAPASTSRRSRRWSATRRSRRGSSRTTEEAVARGVFGAPTFFVGEAMFFGQDRLDFRRRGAGRARRLAKRPAPATGVRPRPPCRAAVARTPRCRTA